MGEIVKMKDGMVQLNTVSDALSFSDTVFKSGLAPSSFKTPQAIFLAVQMGAELGMSPMQSLQGLYAFNGRVAMMNKTARGLVAGSGKLESIKDWFEGTGEDMVAICAAKRNGVDTVYRAQFSVADAKRAGLWGKAGVWTNYPKDMLYAKASARALAMGFSDILIGLPVLEDIQDLPPEKKPAVNAEPVEDPLLHNPGIVDAEYREVKDVESRNTVGTGLPIRNPESNTPPYEAESLEGQSDFEDYQKSQSEANQALPVEPVASQPEQGTGGALSVTGTIDTMYPAKGKGPINIIIASVKIAVWPNKFPVVAKWLCDVKTGWKKGCPKQFCAHYTQEQNGQYTNNTLVGIESV